MRLCTTCALAACALAACALAACAHAQCSPACALHAQRTCTCTARAGAKEVEIRSRLGRFGIENQHAWQPMTKLSGGQKSRVVLCAISWAEPTFLILDE